MVELELGNYLNVESTKDGDIGVITEEADYVEIEVEGKKKRWLNIPCEVGQKKVIYSPPWKVQKLFKAEWGSNTKGWIGKKFLIGHKDIEVGGKDMTVVRAMPIIEQKVG